jgi:tetratricopeptide (TPR) repeat protein
MVRSVFPRIGLVLSVALGGLALEGAVAPSVARAAETAKDATREKRAERRVMKASQVDTRTQKSEEMREKAREARKQAIERLRSLIKGFEGSADQKAEMIMRLSEMYFEEGRDLYLTEMQKYQEAYDACFNATKPPCNPETVKVEDYTTQSREWQNKSIKYYEQILTNYPTFPRSDEAMFYLGQALSDVGEKDRANETFTKLVKVHSESKWVTDAYVLIGEYFFDKNEAFKALTAYKKAVERGKPTRESPVAHDKYAFAMYKLAWCYFNVGENAESINTMKSVVAFSMNASNTQSNIQLQEEALKDLVRFFADSGEMDEAYAYFTKLGKKELIGDMLRRLAGTYIEQGKFELAIQTYKRLIQENQDGPKAPEYQDEIIQAFRKMGKKAETLDEIDRLRTQYGRNSQWARANAANQEAVKSAGEALEKNLRSVATEYHNEARKLKTGPGWRAASDAAQQAYERYLEEFAEVVGNKYSYDVRYQYAELLYSLKKFDGAYTQYMKVVAIDPKGERSRFCAESAIFAADEMMKREPKAQPVAGAKKSDPIPLTDWEKNGLAAMVQFEKLFPTDKNTRKIIYRAAYVYYNKNMFKEASDRFRVVIGMDPKSREAEQAANLILDSFALVEDWVNLKDVSKAFFDQQGLGSSDFKKEVFGIYENASLKLIEVSFAAKKDKVKGAADYLAFYKEFPTSQNADLALNNATVYLRDLGKVREALTWREELVAKFPKSKYYKDQVKNIGFDYETIADFASAAQWYETFFNLDKAHTNASAALYSAALFRNALGEWERAIGLYQKYIATYPDQPNLNGLQIEIAKTYEEHDRAAEAGKLYQSFFTKPPTAATVDQVMFTRLRYGLLMDKIGLGAKQATHWKETLQFFEKSQKAGTPMELAPAYVAQIKFMQAESQYASYMAMKVSGPEAGQKLKTKALGNLLVKQLTAKSKALKDLEATYSAIYKLGAAEYGLASLVRLGKASENMSETLTNSYIPPELTPEQREIYEMGLADKAFPQIEKAVAYYKQSLDEAFKANLYNSDTEQATARLGTLRPDDFPGLFETVPDVRLAAPSTKSASFLTEP